MQLPDTYEPKQGNSREFMLEALIAARILGEKFRFPSLPGGGRTGRNTRQSPRSQKKHRLTRRRLGKRCKITQLKNCR